MTAIRKSQQAKLKIVLQPSYCREHFYINECNVEAYNLVVNVPPERWYNNRLLVFGDEHSGKTHLAHIWQDLYDASFIDYSNNNSNHANIGKVEKLFELAQNIEDAAGVICENIEQWNQELLFHCINMMNENNKPLLMTTKSLAETMLPDLRSRLRATHITTIYQSNDDLTRVIVNKLLSDQQIRVGADIIEKILGEVKKYGWHNIDQIIAVAAKLI